MVNVLLVLLGGGLGSLMRYGSSLLAGRLFGDGFAWGTLFVNLLGCLLIGFVVGCADRALLSRAFRIFVVTGVLGGLTTFSSFSLESARFFQESLLKGFANIALNLIGGLLLTFAGLWLASKI
jgi:fluoride exporter